MFKHGFPPEWSTFKKLIWLVGSGIAGGASGIWKTVTGTLIHITDALASPVQALSVAIEPQQSGSGDPSPTNVRPITGWTGCEVWVKDEYDTTLPATASVTFPNTVYGGSHEFVSGSGQSKMASVDLGTLTWTYQSSNTRFYTDELENLIKKPTVFSDAANAISSHYKIVSWGDFASANDAIAVATSGNMFIRDTRYTDAASLKTALSGVQFVYELDEPIEIQLTPQEISTLQGINNVWSNTNADTTIIYKAQAS